MPYLSPLLTDRQLLAAAHGSVSQLSVLLRDRLSERTFQLEMIRKHADDAIRTLANDPWPDADALRQQVASVRATLDTINDYTITTGA